MSEDTLQIQQYLKDNIDYILSKDNITIFFPPASGQYQDQQDVTVDLDQVFGVPLLASFDNNEMILTLLKENRKFSVDEEKRTVTVHMNTRTTIMLRDIPESTSQEDVKNLFGEYSSFIVDMKPEIGDNYLVDFKTADITQNAFVFVRQQTFNGKAVACCIKSNYNYYTPQYYFPPQENNNFFDYSKDYDENKRGRGGRGRGRGGKKYQNGNYRGNNTKPYYNNRRNESPKVISQDLGSENFPPLSPNSTVRTVAAERKYPVDQLCDIVKGMDEVYPPDWTGTSMVVTDHVNLELEIGKFHPNANIEWINKRGTKPVPGENQNKEKPQNNTQENTSTTTEPKQEIIFPTTTTLRYADIVKQNVEKSPQPKSSNTTFNSYKGTFSVEVKEPKKSKKQQAETQKQQQTETPKTNPTSQEQPLVNPTN